MLSWLKNKISGDNASKLVAKSRLHFVLVQDRTGLNTDEMSSFKAEMLQVIKKFFKISDQDLDISYKRDGNSTTLLINSPIIVRREDSEDQNTKGKKAVNGITQAQVG